MPITPLLADSGFDPEAVALLTSSFEEAWQILLTTRSPLAEERVADATRQRLAQHIVLLAQRGERRQEQLVTLALTSVRQEQF